MRQIFSFLCMFVLSLKAQIFMGTQSIYGIDNREFVSKKSTSKIQELANSIGIVISNESIEKKNYLYSKILKNSNIGDMAPSLNICPDQKFAKELGVNSCSGFLIAEDIFVSAGHCFMNENDCEEKSIIFDDYKTNEIKDGATVLNKNVYKCQSIIKTQFDFDNKIDFSIIKLDRSTKRKGLALSKTNLKTTKKVFMLGHPLGYAMIYSKPSSITSNESKNAFFKAALDSFEGNSGSPVFNAETNEVEGILVYGEDDFYQDEKSACMKLSTYDINDPQNHLKSETITKISNLKK